MGQNKMGSIDHESRVDLMDPLVLVPRIFWRRIQNPTQASRNESGQEDQINYASEDRDVCTPG